MNKLVLFQSVLAPEITMLLLFLIIPIFIIVVLFARTKKNRERIAELEKDIQYLKGIHESKRF